MRAHGIDLSHWDGLFDPTKATGIIDFAIQKVSEGTFQDIKLIEIWDGVKKMPIRGAYHYLRSGTSWRTQADFFISVVEKLDFHFYVLDFEGIGNTMGAAFAANTNLWMDYVCQKTGKPLMLYTNPSHYDTDLFPYGDWMKNYPLWIAQYWNNPTPDKLPALPKKRKVGDWTIWQYASEVNDVGNGKNMKYGTVSKSVDLNVFNGTVADMRQWLKLDPTSVLTLEERVKRLEVMHGV